MKVVITGGGTGGHIYPGLSVASRLRQLGYQAFWLARDQGLEKKLIQDVPLYPISARPLRAKGFWRQIQALLTLAQGIWCSVVHLRALKPSLLLSFGGYVAVAPALAAKLLGIPVVCFEQNTRMGLANRLIAKLAKLHLSGLPIQDNRFLEVGNPLRRQIMELTPQALSPSLLIFGGSQGASVLANELLAKCVEAFPALEVTCIVGAGKLTDLHHHLGQLKQVTIVEYADNIEQYYAKAPLVISRAGAMAVSEIQYLGLSAIYLPLVSSADNHQYHNAMSQAASGAKILRDDQLQTCLDAIGGWLSGQWQVSPVAGRDSVSLIIEQLEKISKVSSAVVDVGE